MALKYLKSLDDDEFSTFIDSFDTVICDCDDVLWKGEKPIPGSVNVINRFAKLGKQIYLLSNNSIKSQRSMYMKSVSLGMHVPMENVFTATSLTASYIKSLYLPEGSKVYLIGNEGIAFELYKLSINYVGLGPDVYRSDGEAYGSSIQLDPAVVAVVVAFDEHFSYPKIIKAANYLKSPNTHFIATNPDPKCSVLFPIIIPGTGAMLQAIMSASEREPVVIGKPSLYAFDAITKLQDIVPKRTIMIGDTCSTDILFGNTCGLRTLLVLTGESSLAQVTKWKEDHDETKSGLIPDFYVDRLGDLLERIT